MGGVSIGCVSIEGVVFYNRTNTYLVVLTVVVCIGLVASCCFLSLHLTFMMHGHKNLKLKKKKKNSFSNCGACTTTSMPVIGHRYVACCQPFFPISAFSFNTEKICATLELSYLRFWYISKTSENPWSEKIHIYCIFI